ncbi:hypothetical protein HR45_03505 [Shewanella mangrovi]|uniref:DUF2897 domain-containing protein n=1 Tax=Shewanella mangrovi TaxID=1515746 RepID=A0A094LTH9_9GAMM|nr:DUF2897 family protein [Shewanella mangrovi]KFZ38508.1 hypothetical protein HR45_03505 [Shewanella mangrovi]
MSNIEAILIIVLVIGVVFSNLAVLKYSAKFKMPQFGDKRKPEDKDKDSKSSSAPKPNSSAEDDDDEPRGF